MVLQTIFADVCSLSLAQERACKVGGGGGYIKGPGMCCLVAWFWLSAWPGSPPHLYHKAFKSGESQTGTFLLPHHKKKSLKYNKFKIILKGVILIIIKKRLVTFYLQGWGGERRGIFLCNKLLPSCGPILLPPSPLRPSPPPPPSPPSPPPPYTCIPFWNSMFYEL